MVILFVFGTIIGSFLNVAALRWNSGRSLGGRSACASCGKQLTWKELIPLVSFLWQRGRCVDCRARISRQYPLVELWTGVVFATVPFVIVPVFCFYTVILIYDLRHKIIPDALSYTAAALALLVALSGLSPHRSFLLLDWLAGPLLAVFIGGLWLVTRGRAIGLGDAKLALSIGFLLGAAMGFSALIVAFWIGALWGLGAMYFSRKGLTMKSELPFAPFLIGGAWLAIIFHLDLLHVSSLF